MTVTENLDGAISSNAGFAGASAVRDDRPWGLFSHSGVVVGPAREFSGLLASWPGLSFSIFL